MSPVALITGAARRLGREMAVHLAQQGFDVAVHYHHSETDAHETAAHIRAAGRRAILVHGDLTQPGVAESVLHTTVGQLSKPDLLLLSASLFEKGRLGETTWTQLQSHFAVHLFSVVEMVNAYRAHCEQGNIIVIADSIVDHATGPRAAYLLAKKSLWEFVKMAAVEFAPAFRVNAIGPGWILDAVDGTPTASGAAEKIPLQKKGDPADILQALDFLIRSTYVTGSLIHMDGGRHLKPVF